MDLKLLTIGVFYLLLETSAWTIDHFGHSIEADKQKNTSLPTEVQKAVCSVTSGEVKASAEATTTTTLKGVCNSEELSMAFRDLEEKLRLELNEMKTMLQKLIRFHGLSTTYDFHPLENSLLHETDSGSRSNLSINLKQHFTNGHNTETSMKSKPILDLSHVKLQRENEINKFNNTLLAVQDFKLFNYYWKLENFTEYNSNKLSTTVRSPVFSLRDTLLQISCIFHYMNRELLYLQLGHVQPNYENKGKVQIEIGGFFKEIKASSTETLKYKFAILDQNNRLSQDLSSQELINFDHGFSIPNSALSENTYVKHNSLLIQIILYI